MSTFCLLRRNILLTNQHGYDSPLVERVHRFDTPVDSHACARLKSVSVVVSDDSGLYNTYSYTYPCLWRRSCCHMVLTLSRLCEACTRAVHVVHSNTAVCQYFWGTSRVVTIRNVINRSCSGGTSYKDLYFISFEPLALCPHREVTPVQTMAFPLPSHPSTLRRPYTAA